MNLGTLDRHRLLLLLAVAIAARAVTFANPIVHVDEDFYFTVARDMWAGALPYVDIWDRKPPGLFLIYLLPAALPFGWGIIAYQALALVAVVITAWIIARLAEAGGWARGATLSGVAYILWLNLASGQGGQSPVFYNPLMAGAALLIIGNRARSGWRDGAAMLLVGLALQVKYSALFEGLFFGIWIMARDWRAGRPIGRVAVPGVGLATLALLPTIAAAGYYAAIGHLDAFTFANFRSISARRTDPALERVGNFLKVAALLLPLLVMAVDSVRHGAGGQGAGQPQGEVAPGAQRFLLCWLSVAIAGIVVFGGWFDHYALPAIVPGAVCAAGFLGARQRGRMVALGLAALIGTVTIVADRLGRGGPAQFEGLVHAIGDGPGCLWVYSGTPKIYAAVPRCRVTRYLFPSHLYRTREQGAIGVDQEAEVRRILALAPQVIVMRPLSIGERPEIRAIVTAAMARGYVVAAHRPLGRETMTIYRRR
ncbi:DUF2029 domain-containing protein [Sphingomonas sp. IC4-52]|uniref:DUF2029 domain-containing protein n=1 Tax=Sphingomonas sp. IC4-52 TaxID=2887202 RepID=UPI001D12F2DB|nr:glycosyltransferase family 87 protein [Sphingomonas sp. IC4-52]MCC2980723.1 DUF2029 domain-containing protein [Sphingomonas sp. IC4-52]